MGGRAIANLARTSSVLAFALSAGCASYGSHLSAQPLLPEQRELSLSLDALLIDRGFGPQLVPNPEVGWRAGFSDDLDFGGQVNLAGLDATARWRVLDRARFDLTLVPGLGVGFVPVTNTDSGLFNASVSGACLGGFASGQGGEWVLGARALATYAFPLTAFRGDTSGAKMLYLLGGVLGFRSSLQKGRYLFPEVNVLVPYDTARGQWSFPTVQAGVSYQTD